MSTILRLHYKFRKLFLIEQECVCKIKVIKEFRELNTNFPNFPKFSNLFINFVKKDSL